MKTILKITFFFFRSKPRFDLAHQIRLLYFLWIKQNKDSTLKEPSKKDNFPIDSIQMEKNYELLSTSSNIAQELKRMFDYLFQVGNLGCSCIWESKVLRFH